MFASANESSPSIEIGFVAKAKVGGNTADGPRRPDPRLRKIIHPGEFNFCEVGRTDTTFSARFGEVRVKRCETRPPTVAFPEQKKWPKNMRKISKKGTPGRGACG